MSPVVLALVLASALLHAAWSVSMKRSRDPLAFNVLQVAVTLPMTVVLLPWLPLAELAPEVWGFLAATAVAHGLYFHWLTRAVETADLTLVYPITRSAPAFLPLLAVPWLGESISLDGALGIALVVVGLWALQGGGLRWRRLATRGTGWAWLTLAAIVAYSLLDKGLMARLEAEPWPSALPVAIALYFLIHTGSALCFLPLARARLAPGALAATAASELWAVVAAAAVSFVGYTLILQALRTAAVSYVVAVRQTSVLFAALLAVVWLRERPPGARLAGSLAIVLGVALIALQA